MSRNVTYFTQIYLVFFWKILFFIDFWDCFFFPVFQVYPCRNSDVFTLASTTRSHNTLLYQSRPGLVQVGIVLLELYLCILLQNNSYHFRTTSTTTHTDHIHGWRKVSMVTHVKGPVAAVDYIDIRIMLVNQQEEECLINKIESVLQFIILYTMMIFFWFEVLTFFLFLESLGIRNSSGTLLKFLMQCHLYYFVSILFRFRSDWITFK